MHAGWQLAGAMAPSCASCMQVGLTTSDRELEIRQVNTPYRWISAIYHSRAPLIYICS